METVIDWKILQERDFSRNNEDPEKLERYQAEALVYQHLPIEALSYLACAVPKTTEKLTSLLQKRILNTKVITQPEWFFS